jgi:hypothetical protein
VVDTLDSDAAANAVGDRVGGQGLAPRSWPFATTVSRQVGSLAALGDLPAKMQTELSRSM